MFNRKSFEKLFQNAQTTCNNIFSIMYRLIGVIFLGCTLIACREVAITTSETETSNPALITDPYSLKAITAGKNIPVSGSESQIEAVRRFYLNELSRLCISNEMMVCERFVEERRRADIPNTELVAPAILKLRDHYETLCQASDSKACYDLSGLLALEFGLTGEDPRDIGPYQHLRLKSCDMGYQKACDYIQRSGIILGLDYEALIRANVREIK